MLIIDGNSVYEIDEECLKKRKVPKECGTAEKVEEIRKEHYQGRLERKSNNVKNLTY